MGQTSWAQIRDFQTTRLLSTAGAGVASVLSTEAAILNPASSSFFAGSTFSYQGYTTTLRHKDPVRDTAPDNFPGTNRAQGAFLADHSGTLKGGTAYLTQKENGFERSRIILHGAGLMNAKNSMGFAYNYIQDKAQKGTNPRHSINHQLQVGTTHIIDEDTILGLVLKDPTRTTPGEERLIAGFQYSVAERFIIIGDIGAQYTKSFSDKYLWRAALQMNIFSDFFLKVGQFYDNITMFKGTGWGASWIGPRFGVEFAQKFSDQLDKGNYVYPEEQLVDSSLSVIMKF